MRMYGGCLFCQDYRNWFGFRKKKEPHGYPGQISLLFGYSLENFKLL